MTSDRRFDQDLPDLLAQIAQAPAPEYRDLIVQRTARTMQRPAWTFPERWLPMSALTTRVATAPRFPLRIVGVVALLLVALIVGGVLLVGSQRHLPAPFGRAVAGKIAYAASGDVYAADPVTGAATAIVTGPETDLRPVWSRDGTRVAFERKVAGVSGEGRLFIASKDGSDVSAVTSRPQTNLASYSFSADGSELVYTAGPESASEVWIAKVDGSDTRRLDIGMSGSEPWFRPSNGGEVVFVGNPSAGTETGIYVVAVGTGDVRPVLAPRDGVGVDRIAVSPDGNRVAYSSATVDPVRNTFQVEVSTIDGSSTTSLPMPGGATFQDAPSWSNDGSRIALVRGYASRNEEMTLAILPADGSSPGIETVRGLTGCCDTSLEWAPDDGTILVGPEDLSGNPTLHLILDATSGSTHPAPWTASGDATWQRLGS